MGLVAVAGGVCAAAVRNEHKVVFGKVNGLLLAVLDIDNLLCGFLAALGFDDYVLYIHSIFDCYAVGFKIFYEGQNHAFVLVVFGETQRAEIRQTVNVVNIAAEVTFHFKGA